MNVQVTVLGKWIKFLYYMFRNIVYMCEKIVIKKGTTIGVFLVFVFVFGDISFADGYKCQGSKCLQSMHRTWRFL